LGTNSAFANSVASSNSGSGAFAQADAQAQATSGRKMLAVA